MGTNRLQVTKVLKTKFEIAAVKKKPLKDLQKKLEKYCTRTFIFKKLTRKSDSWNLNKKEIAKGSGLTVLYYSQLYQVKQRHINDVNTLSGCERPH